MTKACDPPLVELTPIFDVYTDGIARVDNLGGAVRISYATYDLLEAHRVVVAKMIWSRDRIMEQGGLIAQWLAAGHTGVWPGPAMVRIKGAHHAH